MRHLVGLVFVGALLAPGLAHAEWKVINKDANSYSMKRDCSGKVETWSIAGGTEKRLSIPAGATQCTLTLNNTSCTAKDNETCVIQSAKVAKQ
jgi:hypothetical protein